MATTATRLLTVSDAARLLAVSRSFLYRAVESGRLPAYELGTGRGRGRVLRLDPSDLAQLAEHGHPAEPQPVERQR